MALLLGAFSCTTFAERPIRTAPVAHQRTGPCASATQGVAPAWEDELHFDVAPRIVRSVPPVYPQIANEANVTGTVITRALICVDGGVNDVRILRSIPMLDAAAVEAVRQWRFEPARKNGAPLAVWHEVPVTFSLPEAR